MQRRARPPSCPQGRHKFKGAGQLGVSSLPKSRPAPLSSHQKTSDLKETISFSGGQSAPSAPSQPPPSPRRKRSGAVGRARVLRGGDFAAAADLEWGGGGPSDLRTSRGGGVLEPGKGLSVSLGAIWEAAWSRWSPNWTMKAKWEFSRWERTQTAMELWSCM